MRGGRRSQSPFLRGVGADHARARAHAMTPEREVAIPFPSGRRRRRKLREILAKQNPAQSQSPFLRGVGADARHRGLARAPPHVAIPFPSGRRRRLDRDSSRAYVAVSQSPFLRGVGADAVSAKKIPAYQNVAIPFPSGRRRRLTDLLLKALTCQSAPSRNPLSFGASAPTYARLISPVGSRAGRNPLSFGASAPTKYAANKSAKGAESQSPFLRGVGADWYKMLVDSAFRRVAIPFPSGRRRRQSVVSARKILAGRNPLSFGASAPTAAS